MLSRGAGHVVNVSSVAAIVCFPGLSIYSATKAALTQFTGSLRADLRGLPIGVTVVDLGGVETEMAAEALRYAPIRAFGERTGQAATLLPPEQVADAILEAIRENRRHVRLPAAYEAMFEQADRPRLEIESVLAALDVPPRA
jgi:short-subunit dehydrogenase